MAHIDLDISKGDIAIHSEFREKDLCKQVPGARWDKDERIWRAPLSWASCITLRGVFGDDLTVGEQLSDWSWQVFNERVNPAASMRDALEAAELMADEPQLYPFQRAGVKFLQAAGSALIADEMGSGKTIQIIRAIARNPESLPAIVVVPNSVKINWRNEFDRWAPEIRVTVVDGTAAKRRKQIAEIETGDADVLVINWESLRLHSRLESFGNKRLTDAEKEPKELNAIDWKTVVADEAHKAKDANSKQTRALWAISRGANYRYAATGTPIANHPGELWSIMNFVSQEDFPAKSRFLDRYCQLSWNRFGGMDITGIKPERQDEFNAIIDSRMVRRLKEIVLPYLPEKVYQTRYVPMSTKQSKAYRQMADHMLAQIEGDEVIAATNPLTLMTRLSQFASSFAELDDEGNVSLSDPSNKLDALMDLIEEAEGQPVVVFAQSIQLINLAAERMKKAKIKFGRITGSDSLQERQDDIDAFQRNELPVMLVTLAAGGVGITLTAARIAVFLQRSWSLVDNKQAEDRLHRPGAEQHDSIEIVDLVSAGTIEEYRADKLAEKEDRLQEVVRDDELRAILKFKG